MTTSTKSTKTGFSYYGEKPIKKNLRFLNWYASLFDKGYEPLANLDDMTCLVSAIRDWYLIKYPAATAKLNEGIVTFEEDDVSKTMTLKALSERLPGRQRMLFENRYRKGKAYVTDESYTLKAPGKDCCVVLTVSTRTGQIMNSEGDPLFLTSAYCQLNKEGYSTDELRKSILLHEYDKEVLRVVCEFAVSALLNYNGDISYAASLARAQHFIEDIELNFGICIEAKMSSRDDTDSLGTSIQIKRVTDKIKDAEEGKIHCISPVNVFKNSRKI